ncbi:MAG: hypothetical protein U0Q21_01315 [Dermatophilaceae bacterium]
MSPGPWLRLGVTVVALAGLALVLWNFFMRGGTSVGIPPAGGQDPALAILALADESGAVVVTAQHYLGIRRDGSIAWRNPAASELGLGVACRTRCPDVILSGGMQATNDPSVGTPRPTAPMGRAAPAFSDFRVAVLDATPGQELIFRQGRSGLASVDLGGGHTLSVDGWIPQWSRSSDGSAGLLLARNPQRQRIGYFLTKTSSGWSRSGERNLSSMSGCAGPGGRWLVADPVPTIRTATSAHPVTGVADLGNCAFASEGAIVATYTMTSQGSGSAVAIVSDSGETRWSETVGYEARLAANPRRPQFVAVGQGKAVVRGPDGRILDTVENVIDATFSRTGTLITLSAQGNVTWH